jgi:hypothetical protein
MLLIIQSLASFELSCVKVDIQNLLLLMHMWNLFHPFGSHDMDEFLVGNVFNIQHYCDIASLC